MTCGVGGAKDHGVNQLFLARVGAKKSASV